MAQGLSFINQWMSEPTVNSIYFTDNIRRIDAIIVFKKDNFATQLETFILKLKNIGMDLEFTTSTLDNNIVFGKIHAPNQVLTKYAKIYNIPLRKDQTVTFALPEVPCKLIENLLNSPRPDPNNPISKRAWKTISKSLPTEITSRERIVIVFAIMDYINFGTNNFEVGYKVLQLKQILLDAFPLHDGPWEWSDDPNEPLNDRQLLAKYWGSIYAIFKQQPLNIVEKYFGYEIAVYFAWLGFYNKMLVYAALMGIFTILISPYFVYVFDKEDINVYCTGDNELCAEHTNWPQRKFADHCPHTQFTYFNANIGTFINSCFMIIWCTVFNELWKRELNLLDAKWDKTESQDFLLRPQFVAKAKGVRQHKFTGEPELYVPLLERIKRYTLSGLVTMCMLCMVMLSLTFIVFLESILKAKHVNQVVIVILVCFLSALFMTFTEKLIFDNVAQMTAKLEMPRTELEFEKSCMIKSCLYVFTNNFGRIIYIAFLKERLHIPTTTLTQVCMLPGCVYEVVCLMFTLILFKPFFDNFMEVQRPLFFGVAKRIFRGTIKLDIKPRPRWEKEYDSIRFGTVLGEVEEMVIQYGIVSCFVACCPLAPLFALMHNYIEIKADSIKLLKYYKRTIEKKQVSTIKTWFDVFEAMTYVIIVVNAFFIAYTCNAAYVLYDYFISFMKEPFFSYFYTPKGDCYIGRDNLDFELVSRIKFAYQPGIALLLILIGFGVASVLSYIIPDMPRSLREYVFNHERKQKEK